MTRCATLCLQGFLAVFAPGVDLERLDQANWEAMIPTLPVMALAFVFQASLCCSIHQIVGFMHCHPIHHLVLTLKLRVG